MARRTDVYFRWMHYGQSVTPELRFRLSSGCTEAAGIPVISASLSTYTCLISWCTFVLASVEYRLSNEAAFPTQIHDVKAAIRWLRAKPEVLGIDPERVALAGFSAGGHLAVLTATTVGVPELEGESGSPGYSTRVQAAIEMAAPTDLYAEPGGQRSVTQSELSRRHDPRAAIAWGPN